MQKMDEDLNISCKLRDLGLFRIDSFNYLIKNIGKLKSVIDPVYLPQCKIFISKITIKQIEYPMDTRHRKNIVYPSESKLRAATYLAELDVELCFQNNEDLEYFERSFYIPVMVGSQLCFLRNLKTDLKNEKQLINVKEDINDPGGYFIVKGKERLFRHFVVMRRNYPLAVSQTKWRTYRKGYSEYGIIIRSVKDEFVFSTVFLHYLNDGNYEIRLYCNLAPIFIQVFLILKALVNKNDMQIVDAILKYDKEFPVLKLKNMLHSLHNEGIYNQNDAKKFLGKEFSRVLRLRPEVSAKDAADYVLKQSLLVHLETYEEKFEFICFSLCKLHSVVTAKCRVDDLDNPVYQEILSTGQVYFLMLKDGLKKYLKSVEVLIKKYARKGNIGNFKKYCNWAKSLSPEVASMIATGNFLGQDHGLACNTGYTIALKRTNVFQLAAQFTAIYKFSLAHYSNTMRKFYPESWGFICPTQTPEGENTGLYNQLTSQCKVVNLNCKNIDENVLFKIGILPLNKIDNMHLIYPVLVNGRIIGWIEKSLIEYLLFFLRKLKSQNSIEIPYHSEIVFITESQKLFPAIYLFSSPCRLIRKIFNEQTKQEEFIGMLEQLFFYDSSIPGVHSFSEIHSANILSLAARMIPFSENNAAVRNIYSSVKIKQALGLPFYNFSGRADTKVFQLLYGQHPVVSTNMYLESDFSFYPCGTNVIIAVISYSGYDMEDALVLNKASIERGLMQNLVYKTFYHDLEELAKKYECSKSDLELKRNEHDPHIAHKLDQDGLPYVGTQINPNDPILSLYNKKSKKYHIECYTERYTSYVHDVRIMGDVPHSASNNIPKNSQKISITFCVKKVPEAGDKFNTRHGGKGICSKLMESEDMPFSIDGMIPDVLFNPHGLPSRMSIGMLFEMGASKAFICKGKVYVVESFETKDVETYEEIGEALTEAGFSYYGTERFYSGTSGEELAADVFCGSLYYLRLHHLVEEKYQVRSIGPVDEKTNQPINPGRAGAIKFGEMERDAILSHGASVLTLDRLLFNSDKCVAFVCRSCQLLILPSLPDSVEFNKPVIEQKYCTSCQEETNFKIQIPYVLVYLITELAVLGISVKFK